MATRFDAYHALIAAARRQPSGKTITISKEAAKDLGKLTISDLVSVGYPESDAKKVAHALWKGDFRPLGEYEGLTLTVE